jgi:hypothetical protein
MCNWGQAKQSKTEGNYRKDKKAEAMEVNPGRDGEKARQQEDGAEVNTEKGWEPSRAEAIWMERQRAGLCGTFIRTAIRGSRKGR